MKVAVLAVGAFTPLGLDARQTALLVRAKKLVPSRAPLRDRHGAAIGTVRARRLPEQLYGRERMLALGAPALREVLRTANLGDDPLPMVLAAAERRAADSAALGPDFVVAMADAAGAPVDRKRSSVLPVGHAGFAVAIERATQILEQGAGGGRPARVLVGGVDTYYDPPVLAALDDERRLHSAEAVDGFIPSEGGAFALLGTVDDPMGARAFIRDVAVGAEKLPRADADDPAVAAVSTSLLRRVAAGFDGPIPWAMVDVNGERHRVKDWSFATIRNRERVVPGQTVVARPVEELGDLGAATGAVYLVLATVAFELGWAPARELLIALHSEGGERGFFSVEAP